MKAKKRVSPINVSLTVNERDTIGAAKGRARRLVLLATAMIDSDDIDVFLDEQGDDARAELLDVIGESLQQIDATFAAADARKATAGGAR